MMNHTAESQINDGSILAIHIDHNMTILRRDVPAVLLKHQQE
jgi:hypothetical protein